jgi:DNA-repair protein XRCC3
MEDLLAVRFQACGLDIRDTSLTTRPDLRGLLLKQYPEAEVQRLLALLAQRNTAHVSAHNALDLYRAAGNSPKLLIGCKPIDSLLRGGFRPGQIVEICGEAGSGKSQLCMQLALQCLLPPSLGGLSGSAIVIFTEGDFPIRRLHGLASSPRYSSCLPSDGLERTFLEKATNIASLFVLLENRIPILAATHNIRLLIIDSIAELFHASFPVGQLTDSDHSAELWSEAEGNGTNRHNASFQVASALGRLSTTLNIPIVVTNHVRASLQDPRSPSLQSTTQHPWQVRADLGLAWSFCVNARLFLSRLNVAGSGDNGRKVTLCWHPSCPPSSTRFSVTASGCEPYRPTFTTDT